MVVTTEAAGRVLVVDVATGTIEQAIATGQKVSHMLALDRERERAYVANIGSGSVTALDLRDGKRLKSVATGKGAEGIALSPDGHSLWVTNRDEDTVSRVRADTMEVVDQLPSSSFPIRAEITPDGRWVLVTNARSAGLTVIDSESVTVAHKLDLVLQSQQERGSAFFKLLGRGSAPIGIQISPDGKRAYIAHAGAGVIQVLDIEKWQVIGELRAGSEPDGMGWSGVDVQPAFD